MEKLTTSGRRKTAVARAFMSEWVCEFGVPKVIISDRGTEFMGAIFQELCKFL